jgi:hypothetical protein
MGKYLVEYQYTVKGWIELEAKNAIDARGKYIDSSDYGNWEEVINHRFIKATKIK